MADYYGDYDMDEGMYDHLYSDDMEDIDNLLHYDEDAQEYTRIPFWTLFDDCLIPTLSQTLNHIYKLLMLCFLFRVCCSLHGILGSEGSEEETSLTKQLIHCTSVVCGLVVAHIFFEEYSIYLVVLLLLTYPPLVLVYKKAPGWCGVVVSIITVIFLTTCEVWVVELKEWHRIRGAQMILAMKIISVAFDIDSGVITRPPHLLEFGGYCLHVGSIIFGPWISYQQYASIFDQKDKKMSFYWFAKLCTSFVLGLVCMSWSTCWVHWIILEGMGRWFSAYRDAQSFRFSHYFISYVGEFTVTLSGLGASKTNGDVRWDFKIIRPQHVELPRSLVEVVTNWNLPMHYWLKTYVFKNARSLGNFAAVLLTYAASSLLHGLNFQLAAVLFSLGFYSYTEYVFRQKLSHIFSACIQAKRCKADCSHEYKYFHPYVIATNLLFGSLTIFHLTYLGLMFDSSPQEEKGYTMEHTLGKWSSLGFASHWVALGTIIFYKLI